MKIKRVICKICDKPFANSRALGGHMRAHLHFAKLPPKPNTPLPRQRLVCGLPSSLLPLPPHPTKRRSERHYNKRQLIAPIGTESSKVLTDEDVAMCLLVLAGKKRLREEKARNEKEQTDGLFGATPNQGKSEGANDCEFHICKECHKVFESCHTLGHTLGGHRSNDDENKTTINALDADELDVKEKDDDYDENYNDNYNKEEEEEEEEDENDDEENGGEGNASTYIRTNIIEPKILDCSICCKLFASYQALEEHKNGHLVPSNVHDGNNLCESRDYLLDLNLPPPEEEDSAVCNQVGEPKMSDFDKSSIRM